jgi:hypothetical protein
LGVAVPPGIRDSVSHSRAEVTLLHVSSMMMTAKPAAIFYPLFCFFDGRRIKVLMISAPKKCTGSKC